MTTTKKTIKINQCTKVELLALPGIGDTLAQRIINERSSKLFGSTDDVIGRVTGIGKGKMNNILKEFDIVIQIDATEKKKNQSKCDESQSVIQIDATEKKKNQS
eukprot:178333_1